MLDHIDYNNLYEKINDPEEINNLFTWLLSRDISTFKPWVEPTTISTTTIRCPTS